MLLHEAFKQAQQTQLFDDMSHVYLADDIRERIQQDIKKY